MRMRGCAETWREFSRELGPGTRSVPPGILNAHSMYDSAAMVKRLPGTVRPGILNRALHARLRRLGEEIAWNRPAGA